LGFDVRQLPKFPKHDGRGLAQLLAAVHRHGARTRSSAASICACHSNASIFLRASISAVSGFSRALGDDFVFCFLTFIFLSTINMALLTELTSDGAFELRVLGFVHHASRMRDQFIVFFTEGRHAAFTKLGENFVVEDGFTDHGSNPIFLKKAA
jgi:hypothetical protein